MHRFVLTLAGEPPLGWMESLGENAAQMAPSGRLLLASAYAASGDKKSALALIGKPSANLGETPAANENLDSALRDEALKLLGAHIRGPQRAGETAAAASSLIAKINGRRVRHDAGGRASLWRRSRAGSRRTRARERPRARSPARLRRARERENPDSNVRTPRRKLHGEERREARPSTPRGPSPTSRRAEVKTRDDGIELRQKIVERGGKPLGKSVARGAALTATVTVTPKGGALQNVAVVLPLPAGFELENPQLTAEGDLAAGARAPRKFRRPPEVTADERDDRLILFIRPP